MVKEGNKCWYETEMTTNRAIFLSDDLNWCQTLIWKIQEIYVATPTCIEMQNTILL